MVEECTETSIATSLGMPNWWPDLHANSISSWGSNSNNNNSPWQTQNPNSNSSGDEDVSISTSFTNASNQSGLTVESSRRALVESAPANELIGETGSGNQLWNHVLLGNQEVDVNAIGMISSSKGLSTGMFTPSSCSDYLKKIESSWEFMPPSSLNNYEKQFNNNSLFENQRLTKLSNLVSDWSIAPPDHFNMSRFSQSDMISQMKQKIMDRSSGDSLSCYNNPNDMKVKDEHESVETLPGTLFGQLLSGDSGMDYQLGLKNSILGDDENKYYYGMQSVANTCPTTRSFSDVISFNSLLNKPLLDSIQPTPTPTSNLSGCKKPGTQASSRLTIPTSQTVPRKGQGNTSEGKKKRSEEKSETPLKKAKIDSSSTKMQVPKVKLADKVTALQQIVSPFGKTDTASVLGEAIGYIKFLQEQVQLLSNPYMKTTIPKDPWGSLDRKDEFDLKSRGLCLVPISCTPQVYRDNTGSDYWTPTYRGCLYR